MSQKEFCRASLADTFASSLDDISSDEGCTLTDDFFNQNSTASLSLNNPASDTLLDCQLEDYLYCRSFL